MFAGTSFVGEEGRDAGGVGGSVIGTERVGDDRGENDAIEEVPGLDGDSIVRSSSLLRIMSSKSASST